MLDLEIIPIHTTHPDKRLHADPSFCHICKQTGLLDLKVVSHEWFSIFDDHYQKAFISQQEP